MNDDEKSVTILDPSGNTWYMDGSGNIEVTAPKNITLNAGEDITMSAGMNIISTAGENVNTSAGMNYNQSVSGHYTSAVAGNANFSVIGILNEVVYGDRLTTAKKIKETGIQGIEKISENENINLHGKKQVTTNSGEKNTNY